MPVPIIPTPRSRLLDLMKVSCRIFQTTFNPTGIRTGNKFLRQRLRGPALASYYPKLRYSLNDMRRDFPDLQFFDVKELMRKEKVMEVRERGKGAPPRRRYLSIEEGGVPKKKKKKN